LRDFTTTCPIRFPMRSRALSLSTATRGAVVCAFSHRKRESDLNSGLHSTAFEVPAQHPAANDSFEEGFSTTSCAGAFVACGASREWDCYARARGKSARATEAQCCRLATAAQKKVLGREIAADSSRPYPMLGLLEGDVGSGKKRSWALESGDDCDRERLPGALMAPTEILPRQHFLSARRISSRRATESI